MDTQLTTRASGEIITTDDRNLAHNAAAVYLASLEKASSRTTMRGALDSIARIVAGDDADAFSFPWHVLRFAETAAIRSQLAGRSAPATANKKLAALRGVLKAAWRLGQLSAEDYHMAADVANVKGTTLPAGRNIATGELAALMDTCANDQTPAGARDAALVAVLYTCGLRRAEATALDVADFDAEAGTLRVRHGKGNKERLAHVVNGARAALGDWLTGRGDRPGALFLPIRKGGHIQRGRLTTTAIYTILRTRAAQAGVSTLSPHDFRRTFVGDLLDAGADIATVQHLAGHANVTTTARYDRRPEEAKRKAAELLHVPYRRRRLVA